MRLPPLFFVVSSVAGLSLAAGILGLTGSGLVPALTDPALAWTCVAVGGGLEAWATTMLLGAARHAQATRPGGAGAAGHRP
ncbi:MAG: hypothetical protein AB7G23_01025 [Vicinamibacterales bacterium]